PDLQALEWPGAEVGKHAADAFTMNPLFALDLPDALALGHVLHRFPVAAVSVPGGRFARISPLQDVNKSLTMNVRIHSGLLNRSITTRWLLAHRVKLMIRLTAIPALQYYRNR